MAIRNHIKQAELLLHLSSELFAVISCSLSAVVWGNTVSRICFNIVSARLRSRKKVVEEWDQQEEVSETLAQEIAATSVETYSRLRTGSEERICWMTFCASSERCKRSHHKENTRSCIIQVPSDDLLIFRLHVQRQQIFQRWDVYAKLLAQYSATPSLWRASKWRGPASSSSICNHYLQN